MFDPNYAHRNFPNIRPDWLERRTEAVIDPAQAIIDPHHHLWDVPGSRYLVDELLADLHSGHDIRATVHIECKSGYRTEGPEAMKPVGETEFVVACASHAAAKAGGKTAIRACAAIVGYADLAQGAAIADVLHAHIVAGAGLFRGLRVRAAWHADPALQGPADAPPGDLLQQPRFLEGFAKLHEAGLRCDMWVFHTQLPEVGALARAFPDTPIVLNHAGGPIGIGPFAGRRADVFTNWSRDLRELARQPNVSVKLGGLAMPRIGFAFDALETPPSSADLADAWQPYIDTCLEAFGPSRCMFESNFPVDKGMTGYRVLWNAFKRMTSALTPAERDSVFWGAAAAFYAIAA